MPILSLVSLPKRYSVFIPAFSMVEFYSTKFGLTKKEAILKFWDEVQKIDLTQLRAKVGEVDVFLSTDEIEIVRQTPAFEREFKNDMDLFYDIPDSFRDWNFANMAYQSEKGMGKYQILIFEEAKKFCHVVSSFSRVSDRQTLYFKEYLK